MKAKLFAWVLLCVAALALIAGWGGARPSSEVDTAAPTATPTAEAIKQASPTPTVAAPAEPAVAEPTATPTAEESLQQFVLCSRLVANKQMRWGQAPGVVYSDNPNVTGNIEAGDYIQVLTPKPTSEGMIRVKVHPHDGREVGKTDGQVWIYWAGLALSRLDLVAFTCED